MYLLFDETLNPPIIQLLHHVFDSPLFMGKARVLRNPLSFLAFPKGFRTDMARLHDSIAVGRERGFASDVHLNFALLRSGDAGFGARGK